MNTGRYFIPKSSAHNKTDATGQLVIPQKRQAKPIAAPIEQSIPKIHDTALPNAEPTKNAGRISPPLKPAPKVTAVNRSFRANSHI